MKTNNLDIVYCVKERCLSDELRYSLRSLENIPHNKVWIYGGCPGWVNTKEVIHIPTPQDRVNKWLNTSLLLEKIVENDKITEDFIWFNDDFFVLEPIDELVYYYDRNLLSRIADFNKLSLTFSSPYQKRLLGAMLALKNKKIDTLNFEVHVPIIFNRKKLASIFEKFPAIGAKRSLYGNMYGEEKQSIKDVKIYDCSTIPSDDSVFLSTSDMSFREGEVGKYIREKFKKKCKYER